MSWTKNVSVSCHRIEAAEEDYFSKFIAAVDAALADERSSETFEDGELKHIWQILERIDTDNAPSYLFSVARERKHYPSRFAETGELGELTLPDGVLGDVSYGLINPAYKFLLCFGSATIFKKALGRFSAEGVVRLRPIFENGIDEKVLNWDSYKKVSVKMNLPTGDDVKEFVSTKAGKHMTLVEFFGGLKVDITVSAGGRETLSNMMVKDLLPELISNELCTSLIVRGSDFENATPEQFDLKNAPIKYTETLEIEGKYITETDAKQVLMRAMNARASYLFKEK